MDKYLKQLLEKYAKVILPSFGAIVVENEESGNLMFNEYLSYNDGKLDDLIVSESNMELQEAQNMIAKYIRDIQVQIDKGESYDIFELGRFYKNDDGDIEFEGNLKDGPKAKNKNDTPKAAATEKKEKEPEPEKKKEDKPKEEVKTKETKPEPKKEEPKKEQKADSKEKKEVKKDSKPEQKSTEKENKYVAKKAESDDKKVDVKKEPKKEKAPVSPKAKKVKKEKKPKDGSKKKRFGAFFWIAMVLLALVSAGLIYVSLNYEKVKTYMGWNKFEQEEKVSPDETKEQTKEDKEDPESIEFDANGNTVQDTTESSNVEFDEEGNSIEESESEVEKTPEENTEVEPEPQPVVTASNGTHHLIAGSFSDKSNAEGLVEELKSKGMNARILGQFGGLHFVAAESYNSLKEAKADLDRVRGNASGAWIFKYNDN